jgi:hypothetical protein
LFRLSAIHALLLLPLFSLLSRSSLATGAGKDYNSNSPPGKHQSCLYVLGPFQSLPTPTRAGKALLGRRITHSLNENHFNCCKIRNCQQIFDCLFGFFYETKYGFSGGGKKVRHVTLCFLFSPRSAKEPLLSPPTHFNYRTFRLRAGWIHAYYLIFAGLLALLDRSGCVLE